MSNHQHDHQFREGVIIVTPFLILLIILAVVLIWAYSQRIYRVLERWLLPWLRRASEKLGGWLRPFFGMIGRGCGCQRTLPRNETFSVFVEHHPHVHETVSLQLRGIELCNKAVIIFVMLVALVIMIAINLNNPHNTVEFFRSSPLQTPDFFICNPTSSDSSLYNFVRLELANLTYSSPTDPEFNLTVFSEDGCIKFPSFSYSVDEESPYRIILEVSQELYCVVGEPGCDPDSMGYVVQYLFLSSAEDSSVKSSDSDAAYLGTGLNILNFWEEKSKPSSGYDSYTEWYYPTSLYQFPAKISCNASVCLIPIDISIRLRTENILMVSEQTWADFFLNVITNTLSLLSAVMLACAFFFTCVRRSLFQDDYSTWIEESHRHMIAWHLENINKNKKIEEQKEDLETPVIPENFKEVELESISYHDPIS